MLSESEASSAHDRMLLVRSLPSFAGVDEEAVLFLAERSRVKSFRAGDVVLEEGHPPSTVHIVIEGRLVSTRAGERVTVVGRSRGVGLLALLARDERGTRVVADEDTVTLAVSASDLLDAFEENFSFVRNSLRLTSRGLLDKRGKLPAPPNSGAVELGEYREQPKTLVELLIEYSNRGGIFANSNLPAVVELLRHVAEVRLPAGTVLWRVGDPASYWVRIDYGCIRCTSPDGVSVDVGHNFVLGIMDALGQMPRSFEARAETEVVLHWTDLDPFLVVLENHFELARELVSRFAKALLAPG